MSVCAHAVFVSFFCSDSRLSKTKLSWWVRVVLPVLLSVLSLLLLVVVLLLVVLLLVVVRFPNCTRCSGRHSRTLWSITASARFRRPHQHQSGPQHRRRCEKVTLQCGSGLLLLLTALLRETS